MQPQVYLEVPWHTESMRIEEGDIAFVEKSKRHVSSMSDTTVVITGLHQLNQAAPLVPRERVWNVDVDAFRQKFEYIGVVVYIEGMDPFDVTQYRRIHV